MGEVLRVDKECNFPNFRTELLISKLIASITDKQLQDKFLKEKDLDVPKTIEQLQQKTYDREKKKIAILEALIWERDKKVKEKLIHKITFTVKYGKKTKIKTKNRNFS